MTDPSCAQVPTALSVTARTVGTWSIRTLPFPTRPPCTISPRGSRCCGSCASTGPWSGTPPTVAYGEASASGPGTWPRGGTCRRPAGPPRRPWSEYGARRPLPAWKRSCSTRRRNGPGARPCGCTGPALPWNPAVLRTPGALLLVEGAVPEPWRRLPGPAPAAVPAPSTDPVLLEETLREHLPDALGTAEEETTAAEQRLGVTDRRTGGSSSTREPFPAACWPPRSGDARPTPP
ncbi:hypothetical protein SSPIM334S_07164 [Streptomyces spiroverticillatus]